MPRLGRYHGFVWGRLSIGRALLAIAFCGVLLVLGQWFDGFGVLVVFFSPIIILGFVLDRLRGGAGVVGATLGGGIGCTVFAITLCIQNVMLWPLTARGSGQGPIPPTYYVVFLAIFGSGLGYLIGNLLYLLVGSRTGTSVWVVNQADGGKKAMIGYRMPTSSSDEPF